MGNVFVQLPRPAGNGVGAAISTATMGFDKTFVVGSSGGVYEPVTTIEASNDGGVTYAPVVSFQGQTLVTVGVVALLMRMHVSQFVDGVVPSVDLGAASDSANSVTLTVPVGNGSGPQTDTSALGATKTIQIGGPFGGVINVDASEDGGVTWATVASFGSGSPKLASVTVTAQDMRVTREGVPVVSPGLPDVVISAVSGGGGGGGGNAQAFQYTVLGTEPDLSALVITLPSPRANASYLVFPAQADCAFLLGMNVANASRTTSQFTLSLAAPATAGDVYTFFVTDPQ